MRKKGGKQWKEGADTCVLDPVVACTNSADDVLTPEERKNYVSRIVKVGSSDIVTGEGIRQFYPGLVSERLVSIHRIACTPMYVPEDEVIGEDISNDMACKHLRNLDIQSNTLGDNALLHANLISAKFEGGEYYGEAKRIRSSTVSEKVKFEQLFKGLRGAMHAAVSLVDDVGPWYVHADCHYRNILFNRVEGGVDTALADFGRMIIVNNPNDNREIDFAVDSWGIQFSLNNQSEYLKFARYPQHPMEVLTRLQLFYSLAKANVEQTVELKNRLVVRKNALRAWTPYAILRQTYLYAKGSESISYPDLEPILHANNQTELIASINDFVLKMVGIPNYIKKELLIPSVRKGSAVVAQQMETRRRTLQMEKDEPLRKAEQKASLKQRYTSLEQEAAEAAKPRGITGQTGVLTRMFGLGKRRKTRRRKVNASSSRRLPSSPRRTARRSFS